MEVEKSATSVGEDTEMAAGEIIEDPKLTDKSSSSSESNSESSDSEDESVQNEQLQTLESELSTNPSNYESHVQFIKLLRKRGEIDKLREARETMNSIFPLTPSLWMEWTKDEAMLLGGDAVEKLYERGISEYLSVPLWIQYLNYVQEYDPRVRELSIDGISKIRNLFERAVTATSLHVSQGSLIWTAYTELEQAILLTMDQTNIEEREKQVQRIRSIFHRQLSIPLADLRSTLRAYKGWEVEQGTALDPETENLDGISPNVASAYQKAMEMYSARVNHEEQIARQDITESERFQHFMNYLKFEQSFSDPARVQILYERAITDFPVSSDLWLDYTHHLDKTLKIGKVVKDVYSRATRNCPWVGELWVRYLICLERSRASEQEISAVFEKSLQCTFSTFEEYLDLFLTRVDGLRRRISSPRGDDPLSYSLVRETFQKAADYLSSHMGSTDGLLHLHSYWARLELKLANDLVAARGVWESLLKTCGSMLAAWQGYIAMEIELGHINEARAIYRRCYNKRFDGTGSEDICHAWLRFEREFGTLEDLDHAVQKVTPRLEELQLFRLQQESKSFTKATDQREHTLKKTAHEKRKSSSSLIDEKSPAKKQKTTKNKLDAKEHTQEKSLVEANDKEERKSNVEKQSNVQQMKGSNPGKTKLYTDQCTAFISNIDFEAKSEDLRRFFNNVGGVTSIRILLNKFTGKSRGLAYVDFVDDEHLAAAVAKNKQKLFGKKLSIARSNPKQGKKDSFARDGHEDGSHQSRMDGSSGSRASEAGARKRVETIELKGRNTSMVPRNVRPLGWTDNKKAETRGQEEVGDEKPKSNDEFRNFFIKS